MSVFLIATNPYHKEEHFIHESFDEFSHRYQSSVFNKGFVIFENTEGSVVTIAPKQFASVEFRADPKPKRL